MLRQALGSFGLEPDVDLAVMQPDQSLAGLTGRLFAEVDRVLGAEHPDWVVVQGDTTTAFVTAMAAYYRRCAIGHVEAGLRTGNRWAPFPEEVNRSVIGLVADLHFAPTERAAKTLRTEGVSPESIVVTGNTAVDAVLWARDRLGGSVPKLLPPDVIDRVGESRPMMLVTCHRRESFDQRLESMCKAVRQVVDDVRDLAVVCPVHLNPNVRGRVHAILGGHERIVLTEPVDYLSMVWLMDRARLILTDSGGIQEEAPTLGKPVLVMRDATERPEAVETGAARIVGTDQAVVAAAALELVTSDAAYEALRPRHNPFGDGHAAERIAERLLA